MALRLLDLEDARTGPLYGPESWLPVRVTVFMRSQPFETFRRELARYVREEVRGRSFLIAGHRGAGKTALVHRAVEELTDAALRRARGESTATDIGGQRPLLVRLHGPSLFSADLPGPGDAAEKDAAGKEKAPATERATHAALVHLTNALYRAFAEEAARCFRIHADLLSATCPEARELAGQLLLELDKGPGPDVLRAFWKRLGRLRRGVLWPDAGDPLAPPDPAIRLFRPADQGIREIVAIATAAQAFQVCSGAITYAQSRKDESQREQRAESRMTADLGQVLDKVIGLAAGIGIAAGVKLAGAPTGAAAAAGLLTGLAGAVALSWTDTRSRKRADSVEYQFIRDMSLTTLERDLPHVIARIREAGLAPVFVADELDKVPDTRGRVETLIGKLKNLTTDYGFFCFLTNRAYYEDLRGRIGRAAYPPEHTYFSDLLFVGYTPAQMLAYVLRILRSQPHPSIPPDVREPAAWIIFAFWLLHRSRMNTITLVRELARAVDEEGWLRTGSEAIRARPRFRLAACVQVAIDLALDDPDTADRMASDPLFAQRALDAAYRISEAWELGEREVRLDPDSLRE